MSIEVQKDLKVKVSSKNQIVIPAEVREKLGIKPGDTVSFEIHEPLMKVTREREDDKKADQRSTKQANS